MSNINRQLLRWDISWKLLSHRYNFCFRSETILLELGVDKVRGHIPYEAGDHLAVYPQNDSSTVDEILKYIQHVDTHNVPYQLERASSG